MPAAPASHAPSRARAGAARRSSSGASAVARVRWDRLGRIAMLLVLLSLVFLYLSTGIHMLSTWTQSRRDHSIVAGMEREHKHLVREHNSLSSQSTLEAEARQLGMQRPGEQPYIVGNLPKN
jgi:cell division protein FtsL